MDADRETIDKNDVEFFVLTYNRASMLRHQLQSLVDQTVSPAKITVIDNGSTDDTSIVVKEFCEKYEAVNYYSTGKHYDSNVYTFKTAQRLASSKYVGVFHDDDVTHPLFFEYALRAINSYKDVAVVSGEMEYVYNATAYDMVAQPFRMLVWPKGKAVFNELIYSRLSFPLCIYRTDYYKTVQYDSVPYGKMFDNPFLLELSTQGTVVMLRGQFLRYRLHAGSDSNNKANAVSFSAVKNVVGKAKELLPQGLFYRLIQPYILFNYSYLLLRWGGCKSKDGAEFANRKAVIRFMLQEGLITNFEGRLLKSKCMFAVWGRFAKAIRHHIKHGVVKDKA